jgi:hypothetical protein
MRTLIDNRRGRRPLVALLAGLLLLAGATSAEAAPRIDRPTLPTAGIPSTAGTVHAAEAQGYEGGSTGQGPADDAECESYARRLNVLTSQAAFWYREGSWNTGNALDQGAEQLEAEALDRGCFLVNDAGR